MNVVELFAGIGSQKKALTNLGIEHEIKNIAEWYIPAILAYDSIHYGKRDLSTIEDIPLKKIKEYLKRFTFSTNGKKPMKKENIDRMNDSLLRNLYFANKRTNNLVSIDKIDADDIPNNVDVLTYSFPCQDLSNVGAFHGYINGIDRNKKSRSGLLWEVERILQQKYYNGNQMPRILLMENVSTLLSQRHKENFDSWRKNLEDMGYFSWYHLLNALDFGVAQNRKRIFMISVKIDDLNEEIQNTIIGLIKKEFQKNNNYDLLNYLKLENRGKYKEEAIAAQPNNTPSRVIIYEKNYYLYGNKNREKARFCPTITTRQDRHPNSGVIEYKTNNNNYRFLTQREVFLLMGFTEEDYERIEDSNFMRNKSQMFFTRDKYYMLAGNSIVVNVLEAIFKRIDEILKLI